jgi:hypothetical protein
MTHKELIEELNKVHQELKDKGAPVSISSRIGDAIGAIEWLRIRSTPQ